MTQTVRQDARWTALLVAALAACSGGTMGAQGTPPAAQSVTVSVAPDSATVGVGGTHAFAAVVTGTSVQDVTWTVAEGASGGSVDASGLYTAPGTAGTYHVVATSVVDASARGTASVAVTAQPPQIAVSVSPATAAVAAGAQQTFTATVTGSANRAVTWSVTEGAAGGTITSAGVYTAPSTAGTYHVQAKSQADGTTTALATVTVTAAPVSVAVSVSPATAAVAAGAQQTFTATVTGSANRAVTWSVTEGAAGGTITSTGVYTAPATAGTYHVMARSQADGSATAVATVTVTATPVTIAISPTTGSVDACRTLQLSASVSGTTNRNVTWSVQEGTAGGTVSSSGLYTASSTDGTYHVVATSQADASKSAIATLTVANKVVSVAVAPASATLTAGSSQQFTATITTTCGTATATQVVTAPVASN